MAYEESTSGDDEEGQSFLLSFFAEEALAAKVALALAGSVLLPKRVFGRHRNPQLALECKVRSDRALLFSSFFMFFPCLPGPW